MNLVRFSPAGAIPADCLLLRINMPVTMIATTAAIIAANAAHEADCFTTQEGVKFCKEDNVTPHSLGIALLVTALLISYIGLAFYIANKFYNHEMIILLAMTIIPLVIIGLILM